MLKKEYADLLEQYRKEAPEIFCRLPLPKKLAEDLGIPYTDDVLPLPAFLKKYAAIYAGNYDEGEIVEGCCTITPAPQPALQVETSSDVIETITEIGEVPEKPTAPETSS